MLVPVPANHEKCRIDFFNLRHIQVDDLMNHCFEREARRYKHIPFPSSADPLHSFESILALVGYCAEVRFVALFLIACVSPTPTNQMKINEVSRYYRRHKNFANTLKVNRDTYGFNPHSEKGAPVSKDC